MRLRFIKPGVPPVLLTIEGRVVAESGSMGRVEVTVFDANTGARYVDGGYEFSRHEVAAVAEESGGGEGSSAAIYSAGETIVTGATGGLGRAVLARLGSDAIGTPARHNAGMPHVPDLERLPDAIGDRRIDDIVPCAWPTAGQPASHGAGQCRRRRGAQRGRAAAPGIGPGSPVV